MRRLALIALAASLAACNDANSQGAGAARDQAAAPFNAAPPNAKGQTPAFPGQTRAPAAVSTTAYKTQVVASGFDHPWSLAFLPDGRMLVTEKSGTLNLVSADGAKRTAVTGLPTVDARDQGGLLDVALSPDYATTGTIFWCYAQKGGAGNGTAAARGNLVLDGAPRVEGAKVVFVQTPKLDSTKHFGCRFAFAGDGTFFLTLGERSILEGRAQAQRLDGHLGKVIRLNLDGSVPKHNPFVGKAGARPEIWSYGHRNLQSAAINPATGALWTVEHGARGGDELNRPEAGRNYGWPTITYGIEYAGGPIGEGITQKAGMEQPVYYWDPVIGPSGLAFYTGDLLAEWTGNAFVGGLKTKDLVRLVMSGDRVVGEERLLGELGKRIRDVRQGPDGALYVLTDEADGQLIRVSPK